MYKNIISAVYKITNTETKDSYVGSSNNVYQRWASHRIPSTWKRHPNSPLYKDIQKYGVDKFRFQILAPVTPECLKQVEQELIEILHPTYNNYRADGIDVERLKEYNQSEKRKESLRKARIKYQNQLCSYNGETLTLCALYLRFRKAGLKHSTLKAKKYLIKEKD